MLARYVAVCIAVVACVSVQPSTSHAAVVISDGFGDADRDNDGTALEVADVDTSLNGTVAPYVALRNGGTPAVYPNNTMVNEVTAVENAADVGIRWFSIGGFATGTNPDPRAAVSILGDAAGALPETNPSIGYFHSVPNQTLFAEAIDDGLALAFDSKGRGNAAAGFFNDRVELGEAVGDEVRVSFDFRIWLSALNINTNTGINHIPSIGELRFGVYQDTDNQLGDTNTVAGLNSTPAVWGAEHGNFRGDAGTVGANGDAGWFVRMPIDDSNNSNVNQLPAEDVGRINEETNTGLATDSRILSGSDSDFVAGAPAGFPYMDVNKVYNLSLSLKRHDDPATEGTLGDTIFATVTLTERLSGTQSSFSNYDAVINTGTLLPDGISSDSWDYFAMSTAGTVATSDDFDWLIDNFQVEVIGSNEPDGLPGDYNDDDKVDAADYTVWRNNLNTAVQLPNDSTPGVTDDDYTVWKQNFGMSLPGSGSGGLASNAVPEPGANAILLVLVSGCGLWPSRRRT